MTLPSVDINLSPFHPSSFHPSALSLRTSFHTDVVYDLLQLGQHAQSINLYTEHGGRVINKGNRAAPESRAKNREAQPPAGPCQ